VKEFEDYLEMFQSRQLIADQAAESFNCERLA